MIYNCLIIDDELPARKVLINYVNKVPFLNLIGDCENAFQAMEKLSTATIDIIFLDIEMPKLSGLDFLKSLSKRPHVILTTAYREFALDGFELNVTDYLLKPISFERFLVAVNKVKSDSHMKEHSDQNQFTYFKSGKKNIQIYFSDILFIEGLGNYVKIFTKDKIVTTYDQLNDIIKKLPENNFVRIHRSYIVALDKINAYSSDSLEINEHQLTIGNTYKDAFIESVSPFKR
ncbi:MAG: LytTR family DNA-binding domain-containing protein [Flavobacteriaceae bacterium]|nr:LytTR family DNA-binding domain-containing protein [Flavobacteriaceae bacterium]